MNKRKIKALKSFINKEKKSPFSWYLRCYVEKYKRNINMCNNPSFLSEMIKHDHYYLNSPIEFPFYGELL